MREQTSLVKEYDSEIVIDTESPSTTNADLVFKLPVRNWNLIIDSFNVRSKRKFRFSSLECKLIVEYVKKGIPPQHIFEPLGVSPQTYGTLVAQAMDLNDRLEILLSKETLSDDEFEDFQLLMRHPLRILMCDISRAKGISNLSDWEQFNKFCEGNADMHLVKMKSKFRDVFAEKNQEGGSHTVVINLGNNWIEEL